LYLLELQGLVDGLDGVKRELGHLGQEGFLLRHGRLRAHHLAQVATLF
jgi:hypothetical protein